MKKLYLLLFVAAIILFSCHQSFHNGRQYANRNYVKIGPGFEKESIELVKEKNSIQFVKKNEELVRREYNLSPHPVQQDIKISRAKHTELKTVTPAKNNSHIFKKYHIKKTKATKDAGIILNIAALVFGLFALIASMAGGIWSIIITLSTSTSGVGLLALLWCTLAAALIALACGIVGVSLDFMGRGMGLAGIVMGAIGLLFVIIVLLAVLL